MTSSYFEGEHNELAAFGYHRDKKKGKKQIVMGLLCDALGMPVSIEVFKGNTHDTKTFVDQVHKVVSRWGGGEVTFVGDRGMIRGPQIEEIKTIQNTTPLGGIHYISAISKPEIETLLKTHVFQLELFDETVSEVITEEERYILRRNPVRADEIRLSREQKFQALREKVEKENIYLHQHARARGEVALNHGVARAKQLNILPWVHITQEHRVIHVEKREAELSEIRRLDGCYAIRTDLTSGQASKNIVHDRYKDLALVESAFRSSKTMHLELRPIYLHLEERTRAHALVVMLAYMIIKTLADKWVAINQTVEGGVVELSQLCATTVLVNNRPTLNEIPIPRDSSKALLEAASLSLPSAIPNRGVVVSTKKKLQSERNLR